ncbi:hypothetical protein K461DRAFT_313187 [Myriangium duriaei CBS 260.36]|uniref:Gem-associated protein 5 TPR domain-containing protein n=1 Tax=Myriangium duriaei CBS 260.36 TaxID=1168546 RepID=A0A9P4J4Z1_9PEZI|nr:hypothetical protein K461DRAFT_313187 [Myriangium duriaei CBS 260.36]
MSSGSASRPGSRNSKRSARDPSSRTAPAPTLTPENAEAGLTPCAATQHLLLYAQRNVVLCLRHDTLSIEYRLEKHKEDVSWICVDNTSERSASQLMVSYDTGNTAIVWDINSGKEISRFVAYETLLCASFMKNGNIVFGGTGGNIVLFEPSTNEHVSVRLIYDPITAIAPCWDCQHFACGFMNGSMLICRIQPSFTIVHTLSIQKGPSKVTGIQWHGASQKSKTDMLATQTADGDMRVWSIPKVPNGDPCTAIRVLSEGEGITSGPNWFAWSRNGRIVQFIDKEARLFDVRTKNIVMSRVHIADDVIGLSNYASASVLFVLTANHFVQQWNLNPDGEPILIREVQHIPANPPPSPPGSRDPHNRSSQTLPPDLPSFTDSEASGDESKERSPLERAIRAMDADEEQERRDALGPLSPASSRSSNSSGRSSRRRMPKYLYDKPASTTSSSSRDSFTEFSMSQALPRPRDGTSVRSGTSYRSSLLRREVMRSPESPRNPALLDLFPFTNARMSGLPFRTPDYGDHTRTPDLLRKEMLRVVFGWEDDIKPLVRDELQRHPPTSSRAVLLLKWLGELGSDSIVSILGSQAMTSSDWMLLALSAIDKDSQKKAGDAFVQRLLEKGDIHPAVAILLGVGELDEAIEAYVSQKCYMEALLLTCLIMPSNWDRQCFLLKKWGEVAVKTGSPELAVRIFSCTSEETSAPWASPRAQDAVFSAHKDQSESSQSPLSPGQSARLTAKNASLKLITTFGDKANGLLPAVKSNDPMSIGGAGVTPIADSALSPDEQNAWFRKTRKDDPASAISARTATPGSYNRRRQGSQGATPRIGTNRTTPQTASREFAPSTQITSSGGPGSVHSRTHSHRPISSVQEEELSSGSPARHSSDRKAGGREQLPSPVAEALVRLRQENHARNGSRDRMPDGLHLDVIDTAFLDSALSPALPTQSTDQSGYSMTSSRTGNSGVSSPPLTAGSGKGRALEHYLSSLEQAGISPLRQHRPRSKARTGSRVRAESKARAQSKARAESRNRIRRERSESRGRHDIQIIPPAKRSPSSPVAMSPDEVLAAMQARMAVQEAEKSDSSKSRKSGSRSQSRRALAEKLSRPTARMINTEFPVADRGRSRSKKDGSVSRSPSSPLPRSEFIDNDRPPPNLGRSHDSNDVQASTPNRLHRSSSLSKTSGPPMQPTTPVREQGIGTTSPIYSEQPGLPRRAFTPLSKELAAKELEERRLSLARRPSAPQIPLPGGSVISKRPGMAPRSQTELGDKPASFLPPHVNFQDRIMRSHSVDVTGVDRPFQKLSGTSTTSVPIGLPANPRAMLHGRSMSFAASRREDSPVLPPPLPLVTDADAGYLSGDMMSPLLPNTTYSQAPTPDRSASVPIDPANQQHFHAQAPQSVQPPIFKEDSFRQGHTRSRSNNGSAPRPAHQHSPPIVTASIDETIHDSDVYIEQIGDPPLLPELQHLVEPPPPPPPPMAGSMSAGNSPIKTRQGSFGYGNVIQHHHGQGDIAISLDATNTRHDSPVQPMERAFTASPPQPQRRGRGSVSEVKSGLGSRIRLVTDRMRSTSRSGKKSPPVGGQAQNTAPSPYETVLPYAPTFGGNGTGSRGASPIQVHQPTSALSRGHQRRDSASGLRTKSPYETQVGPNVLTGGDSLGITYNRPNTAPGGRGTPSRLGVTQQGDEIPMPQLPQSTNSNAPGYIRNPKEIRANMPPDMLHQGMYVLPTGHGQHLPPGMHNASQSAGGVRKPSITERQDEDYVPEMI